MKWPILSAIVTAILSIFGVHHAAPPALTAAAAAPAVVPTITSLPDAPVASSTHVTAASSTTASAARAPSYTTILERVIVASTSSPGITQRELDARLDQFRNSLWQSVYLANATPPPGVTGGGPPNTIALANRIDSLSNVSISNATISGVSGLTASDIPHDITASNYLPLTGGTISGDLTVMGAFTGASISFSGASTTSATSTTLFATLGHFATGIIDALTSHAATITNLIATTITGTNATFTNATTTNFAATGKGYFGGSVGVGTSSPFTTFSVNGNGFFSGTLIADVSWANVTAAGASSSRSLADRAGDTINVLDFGAKCDGVTDDTAAINAAFNAARSSVSYSNNAGVRIIGPSGTNTKPCLVTSIDATRFNNNGFINVGGAAVDIGQLTLQCSGANNTCLDFTASMHIHFHDSEIIGSCTSVPKIGLQESRTSTAPGNDHRIDNILIGGCFTFTAIYNMGVEKVAYEKSIISNSYLTAPAWTVVLDGSNHWNASSAFTSIGLAANSQVSFTRVEFDSITLQLRNGVSPLWMEAAYGFTFINTYIHNITPSGGYCVSLYTDGHGNNLRNEFNLNCEDASLLGDFFITGSTVSPSISGFVYRSTVSWPSISVFKEDTNITAVTMTDADIHINSFGQSPVLFGNSALWTFSGSVFLPSSTYWNQPANFTGGVTLGSSPQLSVASATSTNLAVGGNVRFSSFGSGCVMTTDVTGNLICGSAGAPGVDGNWTFFNASGLRLATTTNQVLIGTSATTSLAALEVAGSASLSAFFKNSVSIATTSAFAKLQIGSGDIYLDRGQGIYGSFNGAARAGISFGAGPVFQANDLIFKSGVAVEGMRLTSNGFLAIGSTTPPARLTVWGPDSSASTTAFVVANSASTTEFAVLDNGNATLAGNLVQNSDQRLKTNVQSLDASSALAAIKALNPVSYSWIDPERGAGPQYGFIAQDVQKVFPNLVTVTSPTLLTPDGTLSLNYNGLIAPIVKSIQALSSGVSKLEAAVAGFADRLITKELVATNVESDVVTAHQKLCVSKSDGTPVCVTGDQLQAVLDQASQQPVLTSPAPQPSALSDQATTTISDAPSIVPDVSTSSDTTMQEATTTMP